MIAIDSIPLPDAPPVSFSLPGGAVGVVVCHSERMKDELVRQILGRKKPAAGTVTVLGHNLALLPDDQLLLLRSRVGLLQRGGGLISNLTVVENVTLPLRYHRKTPDAEAVRGAMAALDRAGYTGNRHAVPGHLSPHDRELVALARMMLVSPDLVVYDGVFDGHGTGRESVLAERAITFHRESPERTSLCLSLTAAVLDLFPAGEVFRLHDHSEPRASAPDEGAP